MKTLAVGAFLIAATLIAALAAPRVQSMSPAPALSPGEWINGNGLPFRGHVTILHFWTFGCINCQHNLPYVAKWAAKYDPKEVQVIGIHTPELDFEKDPKNVRDAVKRMGITYPVLIDGKGENWNHYDVEAWPTVILIDKEGRIRKTWVGELQWNGQDGFGEMTQKIERLRQERG